MTTSTKSKTRKAEPLRFAHPFFTTAPHPPGEGLTSHIETTLSPIPSIRGDGRFTLADVIGQSGSDGIEKTGQITLHIAGDTGVPEGDHETKQVMVADVMAKDYNPAKPELSPAFFLHVGDVIYGSATSAYQDQFYRPYMHYPGKIVAIPGNHDGESTTKLKAFQKYFCATGQTIPAIAGSIFRETMNQPGVYWCLEAPFIQIVGMYSNCAENPGYISSDTIGQKQKQWLVKTLTAIKAGRKNGPRKALLFATHHPPYSSGGHSGSTQMLADIDDACQQAGIMPDAFVSGHAHSIQHYSRTVTFAGQTLKIPYIVTGCAGHGGQTLSTVFKKPGNPVYEFGYKGWGYTKLVATAKKLTITSYGVIDDQHSNPLDVPIEVNLS